MKNNYVINENVYIISGNLVHDHGPKKDALKRAMVRSKVKVLARANPGEYVRLIVLKCMDEVNLRNFDDLSILENLAGREQKKARMTK